jgi:hypothetical protein
LLARPLADLIILPEKSNTDKWTIYHVLDWLLSLIALVGDVAQSHSRGEAGTVSSSILNEDEDSEFSDESESESEQSQSEGHLKDSKIADVDEVAPKG